MSSKTRHGTLFLALFLLALLPGAAAAQVIKDTNDPLDVLAYVDERLHPHTAAEPFEDVEPTLEPGVREGWAKFRLDAPGAWKAHVDTRNGRIDFIEGAGIPWLPGRGNGLTREDIAQHLGNRKQPDLSTLESIARSFLPRVAHLLGVTPNALVLNPGRSGQPAEHIYFVDFDVTDGGVPIDGARVVFRINNGNLIQVGSENVPPGHVRAPKAKLTREQALAAVADYIGGFHATDTFLDGGSLHLLPTRERDARFNDGFEPGKGRGLLTAWQLIFVRDDGHATWRARVDAVTGKVIDFRDINEYAQVTGGAKFLGTSVNMPMPFANISSGGFTNSAGIYTYPGGTVTSTLAGQFVQVSDSCGAISLAADGSGNIAFGTSAGTDCTTPGVGGAGNTHSSRTQFYHVNRAKEISRGWLPGNTWLNAQLTANVNINLICNASWNGSTINFRRSGGGCGNTGEIEGVSLHEFGHGLDSNDGNGSSPDNGTGETYGDWTAALATHTSCVGPGFRSSNCGGYGDACTSCTGVRDIDWAKHTSGVAHTVANFTQPRCPTTSDYFGPCSREGHCESYISSEALWDFVNRDLPNPGSGTAWAIADRLWYLSRSTATAAFSCTASGTWTSNGCNTGSLWRTLRAVDDDDGNLSNGTPNSAALFAAFNRHSIACTTDAGASTSFRGCTQPAVPTLSLTPGNNQVTVSWSGSTGVFDVYRNERGCNSGFIKVGNDLGGSSFTDTGVANGFTYYYQVSAQPSGNESCASAPSTCLSVTPTGGGGCTPPAAPTGLTATAVSTSQINLSWNAVAGATEYRIYRSTTSGGPYTQVDTATGTTFSDAGLTCNTTYYYVVRAFAGCESGNSNQASATTSACGTGLKGEYFTNAQLSGSPALVRTDATIDYDWVVGSPHPTLPVDWFSVRWTGQVQAQYTQTYTFYTRTDDGVRLWVNGQLLIDKWVGQSSTEWSGSINLTAGQLYNITMEYFDGPANAEARLLWSSLSTPKQVIPSFVLFYPGVPPGAVGTGLTGEYFNNAQLSGSPALVRTDATVNYDWAGGSPHPILPSDWFSVRWTGLVQAHHTQTYTFYTRTDDGVRLWVNGQLLIDKWVGQGSTEWSGSINLTAGQLYNIRMEYFEGPGNAEARLLWSSPSTLKQVIPQVALFLTPGSGLRGEYFNNAQLSGSPALVRTDPTINYDWAVGSPHPTIPVDWFSVRWTGQVRAQYTQSYTFYTRTDDGVRLWVNGQLLIDKWVGQASTEWSGSINLVADQMYSITMEYFDGPANAEARLLWSSPSTPKQAIPQGALYP